MCIAISTLDCIVVVKVLKGWAGLVGSALDYRHSSYTTFIDKHQSVYHYLASSALSGFSQLAVPSGGCTLW